MLSSSFGALDEMDREGHVHKKVKVDELLVPASEDEAIEVQHLLAEPKTENVSFDGVLCFEKENSWKCSEIAEFSYGLEYELKRNYGGPGSSSIQVNDDFELGVLDGLLDDVYEMDDVHAANDISGACEDFLLDIELSEKVSNLDCAPLEALLLGNLSSESQSPGFSRSSSGALGLSESSIATIPESNCKDCSLEKMVKCELHVSGDACDCQTPADGEKFPSEHVFKRFDGLENDAVPPFRGMLGENGRKVNQASKTDTSLRQKRLRKQTKRYIEEYSDSKSKHAMGSDKVPSTASKDKLSKAGSLTEPRHVRALTYAPKEESVSEIQETDTKELSDIKLKQLIRRTKIFSTASKNNRLKNKSQSEYHHVKALKPAPIEELTQETDVEELTDLKLKHFTKRPKIFSTASKNNCLKLKFPDEHHHVKALKPAPMEESFPKSTTQAPSGSRPRRAPPRKCARHLVRNSDDEQTTSESEDEHAKRTSKRHGDRRKNQRMWTLSEVVNLVDGIAQYGTGRWTDIKNLLFSSSAYRTPVDLRDKWRNLLKAYCAQKSSSKDNQYVNKKSCAPIQDSKEVKQKLKNGIPKSVLCRIHELASLHPYPRFSPGGRYIRRKN